MTTSFTRTREQIATLVLGKLGIYEPGASIASADSDTVYEALDLRLKSLHADGIFWRKVTTVPVTFSLTAGTNSASAGAGDILFPLTVTFVNGTSDDPVELIGIREYASIPDKAQSGNPEKVLWTGSSEFLFWPVPSANGVAKLTYEKIADDTASAAAADVDVAMIRSLVDLVKYDVGDQYAIDANRMGRYAAEAQIAERTIRKLSAQHVDYAAVQVDDYGPSSRNKTDWHTG